MEKLVEYLAADNRGQGSGVVSNQRGKRGDALSRAVTMSFLAGLLILGNSALLGAAVMWFPWVIPTLPGPDGNASVPFPEIVASGLMLGALVLIGAAMLRYNPENRRVWGVMIAVFSAPSVFSGGGFIVGFILGIVGGARAFFVKMDNGG